MRIKFQNQIAEIEYFNVSCGTDKTTIDCFVEVDGAYWKSEYEGLYEQDKLYNYRTLGAFCLGKYKKNWLEIAEKFANEISTKMLEQGYIDLDKYKNFELY